MRPFVLETAHDTATASRLASRNGSDENALQGTAQFLAGGTNLLDLMKLDIARPSRVIAIAHLGAEHRRIAIDDNGLSLGALVRMAEAAEHPVIRRDWRVVADSLWQAASAQLRNMATLAG